ncbi:MAG: MATE family efflux transporter [Paracoccaceae bacterium]
MTTTPQMTYSGHTRALLILGLPLVGGHLGQAAIGITDVVMLGRYSVEALAAITLGSTFFHVFFLMGSGFAWAVMPMVAAFAAEEDEVGLRRATRMGLWLSIAFSLICLPVLIFSDPILRAMGQVPEVAAGASDYLRIAGWGIIPALAVMVLKSYLAALERTQPVLWIILGSAVVNGLANWVLIFGNLGAPELGLQGAAIASIVTQVFTLIGVAIYARWALPEHDLFARMWRIDGPMMLRVFRLGWPIGLTTLSEVGLFSATAVMMGWLGTVALATHGIVLQLATITFMIHLGLSNAATVRAGNALGRRDAGHLARGAWVAFALSLITALLTMVGFLTLPDPLISLFMNENEAARQDILTLGAVLLILAALFQLVDGAQVIALGLLRGVQDTRVPMIMAVVSYWIIGMPASYVLGFVLGYGAVGVWLGLVLGLTCAAVMLMWRFWKTIRPRLAEQFA